MKQTEFYKWLREHETGLSRGVQVMLNHVDKIESDNDFPTSCIQIEKGVMTLVLGKMWDQVDDHEKGQMLQHEAGHLVMGHIHRFPDRTMWEEALRDGWSEKAEAGDLDHVNKCEDLKSRLQLWNVVTDASMHATENCCHVEVPIQQATFESLELPVCPPEVAYDMLLGQRQTVEMPSCGGFQIGAPRIDGSSESLAKMMKTATGVAAAGGVGGKATAASSGTGRYQPLPEVSMPPWFREVIDRLVAVVRSTTTRRRSWAREHRGSNLLPGQSNGYDRAALFLVDASGSISHEDLAAFIVAVSQTPELAASRVAVYSHGVGAPTPCVWPAIRAQLEQWQGGGTDFMAPAALRTEGEPVVWLTDGYPCGAWPPIWEDELWVITKGGATPPGGRQWIRAMK